MSHMLQGRHAIVTGGAQGLGLAIAQRLLQSGATVTIWDRSADSRSATLGQLAAHGVANYEVVDQAKPESVEAALHATLAYAPRVDILVNNAGVIGPSVPLWEYPITAWREVIDIDLNGLFYCCRAVIPHMLEHRSGRIVNVTSIAGKEGNPRLSGYSAAKAGAIGLTKSLGKELATSGILVNAIAPSVINTAMTSQVPPEVNAYLRSRIPMDRFGEPHEVAAMVHWLCSDEVSFTTGAVFDLSGGRATY
jgi:2-dehydro-3-deoxy-L-rhamnonate dehydrogenase (NAD+)